jgi:hypothetical protein
VTSRIKHPQTWAWQVTHRSGFVEERAASDRPKPNCIQPGGLRGLGGSQELQHGRAGASYSVHLVQLFGKKKWPTRLRVHLCAKKRVGAQSLVLQ